MNMTREKKKKPAKEIRFMNAELNFTSFPFEVSNLRKILMVIWNKYNQQIHIQNVPRNLEPTH